MFVQCSTLEQFVHIGCQMFVQCSTLEQFVHIGCQCSVCMTDVCTV